MASASCPCHFRACRLRFRGLTPTASPPRVAYASPNRSSVPRRKARSRPAGSWSRRRRRHGATERTVQGSRRGRKSSSRAGATAGYCRSAWRRPRAAAAVVPGAGETRVAAPESRRSRRRAGGRRTALRALSSVAGRYRLTDAGSERAECPARSDSPTAATARTRRIRRTGRLSGLVVASAACHARRRLVALPSRAPVATRRLVEALAGSGSAASLHSESGVARAPTSQSRRALRLALACIAP